MSNIRISELTQKTTPADSDDFPIVDNADTPTTKRSTWANIKATLKTYFDTLYQAALGYTAEDAANKETSALDTSTTKYPCNNVVKGAVDAKEDSANKETSALDTSTTKYPCNNVVKGAVDAKEDSANKKTSLADNSDTYYPSQKAVKTAVDAKQATLVSGTNIKTVNSTTLLGSGDLAVAPKDISINEQTDNYTLVLADDGKFIDMNKATAVTLTVPKNATVAFPVGAGVILRQKGAGTVTIAPVDGDVTINYQDGLNTTGQHAVAALLQVAANVWVATGSLEA